MSEIKTGMKARLLEETKTLLLIFVYLFLLLGAFTTYRRLILAEYGIGYFQYGTNFVEALVLSKVIVLGRALHLGSRFDNRPLVIPTLYKTLWFSLFILAFSTLERLVVGWLHGNSTGIIVDKTLGLGVWEILAQTLVKVLALLPLLAVWEIGRVLGEGTLFELFFQRGTGQTVTKSESTPAAPPRRAFDATWLYPARLDPAKEG